MPLQNRVTPDGAIVAVPERGTLMGNRGILHDADQRLGRARWRHRAWIICLLRFKDWHRPVMAPHRYTELFFLDEAVALAAGHRPCALCRPAAYRAYRAALAAGGCDPGPAPALDRLLHAARVGPGGQVAHTAEIAGLPDGVFLMLPDAPRQLLLQGDRLLPYAPGGYLPALPRPAGGIVRVLTPRPSVLALAQGYVPLLHGSAVSCGDQPS